MNYIINEDIVYLEKEGKLVILFIQTDEVVTLSHVVAEIFHMMAKEQDYDTILKEVKEIYTGDESPELALQNTIKQFLDLNLFTEKKI